MRKKLESLIAESPPPPASRESRRPIDADDRRNLAALGYIGAPPQGEAAEADSRSELDNFEPTGPSPMDQIHSIGLMCSAKGALLIGNYPEAERFYRELLELNPNKSSLLKDLADTLAAQGGERAEEAIALFRQALDADEKNDTAHFGLATLLAHRGEYPEAEVHYRAAISLDPRMTSAHHGLANLLAELGRWAEAWREYEATGKLDPELPGLSLKWGMALLRGGRIEEGMAKLEEASAEERDRPDVRSNVAMALKQAGRLAEAIDALAVAVQQVPDDPSGHRGLGQWCLEAGRFELAVRHLLRAAELQPELPQAWALVGTGEMRAGNPQRAVGHFRKALELDSSFAPALSGLGRALSVTGHEDEAIRTYQRWTDADPKISEAHLALARLLSGRGDAGGSIAALRRAHKELPDDIAVANELGWCLATCPSADLRSGAEAVELAETANQATEGQAPEILDTLAAAYAEVGRFEEAVATADKAVRLAKEAGADGMASRISARRDTYAQGQPHRDD